MPIIPGSSELIVTSTPTARCTRERVLGHVTHHVGDDDVADRADRQRDAGVGDLAREVGVVEQAEAVIDAFGAELVDRDPDVLRRSVLPGMEGPSQAQLTAHVNAGANAWWSTPRSLLSLHVRWIDAAPESLPELVAICNASVPFRNLLPDSSWLAAPPEKFAGCFELVGAAGLRRTSHTAEDGPPQNISTCLDALGCERIDHGYHILDDGDVVAVAATRASTSRVARPPRRSCTAGPTSRSTRSTR